MRNLIDLTNAKVNPLRIYGGKNGNKICVNYENEYYMVKFPPKPSKNPEMSYTNSCISEDIGCRIFASLGFDTQETFLARYGNKIVVACKDFVVGGFSFKEFAHLKNAVIDSSQSGYGTELSDVLHTIHEQELFSSDKLENYFWNMFVSDALIGNFDRHNGNWGFLINENTTEVKIAPVFDCGSCLYPQMKEDGMKYVLGNNNEIEKRLFEFPNSVLRYKGVKINYLRYLTETNNECCIKSLKDICDKVDLKTINKIIDDTPYISESYKEFLSKMINERKVHILDKALSLRFDNANV